MDDRNDRLLKEFVRAVISEDDTGGGAYAGGVMSGGGWGMGSYGGSLKSIFVDPFLDAGKVIKASTTKMVLRLKTLAKVAIESILTTTIPFLKSNYQLIFKNEAEELRKLREKYKKSFEAVDKAFTKDVMLVSFMVNPEAYIGAKFAATMPGVAIDLLSTLAVGNESVTKYLDDVKKRLQAIEKEVKDDVSNYKLDQQGKLVPKGARGPYLTKKKRDLLKRAGISQSGGGFTGAAGVAEATVPQQQDPRARQAQLVTAALKDPNVQRQLAASPLVKQMKADAQQIVSRVNGKVMQEAQRVLSARTLEDLQKATGKRIEVPGLEQVQGPDRASLEEAVLTQVKAAMKEFYVTSLENEIKSLDTVDPNNLYIRSLKHTLKKLAAL